ncbi:1-acyl-sn-glycerol-3-phosphate acyltransferase [Primorskyibacter sp. S187A]|uniref:1-acyl-sn-glycerol-3-phosphate acyltransferase n=1 Tax=Primorskyibacter sp. S187A TaxID=3415130 RepID=UPI003C7CA8DD
MFDTVTMPVWLLTLILLFAAVTFASHFLFPSVRWFLRRRMERAVSRLNERLERPIEPFKLTRRTDTIQRLIYDPEVTHAVVEHARETGVREDVAFEQAKRYAREIVPSFSAGLYFGFAIRAARFISNALYRVRLGYHAEDALTSIEPDATVVFVMNHRSNMDYVLVTYLAAERSALSYAVGEWARIWPISRLIRAMGAYFIRRRSRNALYRKVLARYVAMATQNGVAQAMFPEGGLSLNGALAAPRVGLLKYIVDGWDPEGHDVVFVPVAINYDRVLEDRVLMAADRSGERRFAAPFGDIFRFWVKQLSLRIRGKFHRFGYAAVSFGAPVSLRASPKDPEVLASLLVDRIGDVVPVLPVPLVAAILLEQGPSTRAQIEKSYADRAAALPGAFVHIPRDDMAYAVETGLRMLLERGFITDDDGLFVPVPDEAQALSFYANSIVHLTARDAAAQ